MRKPNFGLLVDGDVASLGCIFSSWCLYKYFVLPNNFEFVIITSKLHIIIDLLYKQNGGFGNIYLFWIMFLKTKWKGKLVVLQHTLIHQSSSKYNMIRTLWILSWVCLQIKDHWTLVEGHLLACSHHQTRPPWIIQRGHYWKVIS